MSIKATRHHLSKKETKTLVSTLLKLYPSHVDVLRDVKKIEEASVKKPPIKVYLINDIAAYVLVNNLLIPTLVLLYIIISRLGIKVILEGMKYVIVNEGAVKPILRGADVMAPGITDYTEFNKDDIVIVLEPKEKKPIAVTKALMNIKPGSMPSKGKVLKNLHYIGDKIWKISLTLSKIGGPAGI